MSMPRLHALAACACLALAATAFAPPALRAALSPLPAAHADGAPRSMRDARTYTLPGLRAPAVVLRDEDGVPHVYAHDEHDALFMQGWVTAQDRLFQIDTLRRTASGTLAELVGTSALASDVELRTIGLRRAAARSLAVYSREMRESLEAYARGVNAWVAANPLPPEYAALEITRFEPWTALDSAVIGKALAFQLSFDLDTGNTLNYLQYQGVLTARDPVNGPRLADALFFGDVFRAAPFDPAASVPDANGTPPRPPGPGPRPRAHDAGGLPPDAARLLREYRERLERVPFLKRTLERHERQIGSNQWAVSGAFTRNGRPLVANDPHLSLDLPPNFHDVSLNTFRGGLAAIGSAVAGSPWIVLGQNRHVTWGETTTGFDVTDTYREQLVPDATSPSGFSTLYQGRPEHVIPVPVTFRANLRDGGAPDTIAPIPAGGAIPPAVLIVPRRNDGPIVQADLRTGVAFSVQYAGFGPTRELETFRLLNYARNLDEFRAALQYFDVGSQNFIYGDVQGNVAYFTTGEVPLREDLQNGGRPNGAPPWFVRNGQGGNEWLRKANPGPLDGTGYEYLPFEELPQVVNPRAGFVVNANNDPAGLTLDNDPLNTTRPGGGVYYLGYAFDFGTRAGRITQVLREQLARGRVDARDMVDLQADVTLYDASVLAPLVVRAFDAASRGGAAPPLAALAADPRVADAVQRLRRWDHTAPTGLDTGWDAADRDGRLRPPTRREIDASIAATIWSVWRGQAVRNGVDRALQGLGVPLPGSGEALKALRHLLERDGVGLSGVDFYAWTGLPTAPQRRDFVLLQSLKAALDLLSGPAFERAFARSTNPDDWRWGKLHRITFDALLGGAASIPGAGTPQFPASVPGLPGLAVDGGFGVVDASSHNVRAAADDQFTFGSGPNRRYVGSPGWRPGTIDAQSILPGGNSGRVGSAFYANMLGRWLTNDTYSFRTDIGEVVRDLASVEVFRPGR